MKSIISRRCLLLLLFLAKTEPGNAHLSKRGEALKALVITQSLQKAIIHQRCEKSWLTKQGASLLECSIRTQISWFIIFCWILCSQVLCLSGCSDSKASACNSRDLGSIPGLGRSPGEGNGNPLQYSCLENPQGLRSLVGYSPWRHKEPDTTERLHLMCYSNSLWKQLIFNDGLFTSNGEGSGNPLQYSCLENSINRGALWTTICGVTNSWTRLSD